MIIDDLINPVFLGLESESLLIMHEHPLLYEEEL